MKTKPSLVISMVLLFLMSACSVFRPGQPEATEAPGPVASQYQAVVVDSVEVRVGVGSPIPVHVLVSGKLPDTCAQLSQVFLERDGSSFNLQLNAVVGSGEGCIADSLPFRAEIPLNVVSPGQDSAVLGSMQVSVNGVTAAFNPFEAPANRQQFDGISFSLDPAVAGEARGENVPENLGSPDGPYWEKQPAFDRITLGGYPVAQSILAPQIAVYPLDAYRQISPEAGQTLDRLQALLAERPTDPQQIPSLPVINAGQIFLTNVRYMDFQNGSGVRFLAVYGQGLNPITNGELLYGYQGLTADGRYAVSVFLPVNHPSLPASAQALSQGELDSLLADYSQYTSATAASLMAQPDGSFTPALDQLDRLIASLRVEK